MYSFLIALVFSFVIMILEKYDNEYVVTTHRGPFPIPSDHIIRGDTNPYFHIQYVELK